MQPCMNQKCWSKIEEMVKEKPGCTFLEWGSGYSTVELCKLDVNILSVEHDFHWFVKIVDLIDQDKVEYHCNVAKTDYINVPDLYYDFILVDGIHRKECMERVKDLKWNVLMLHDAERPEYKPYMDMYKEYKQEMLINLWICYNDGNYGRV